VTAGVLVVQHESICPPGRLGHWLAGCGVEVDVVRPYAGEPLPDQVGHDGLVVLGGTMGANDDHAYEWLAGTKRLLAEAVDAGVPVLGVCLGHQLLAVACGGRVQTNPNGATIGLRAVRPLDQPGRDDPLLAGLPSSAVAIHWNDDIVTRTPPGAAVLASTEDGAPQVIQVGEHAWGVQFHPEADARIVTDWADRSVAAGALSRAGADTHLAALARADAELAATWRPWAARFAGLVLSSPGAARRSG